MSLSSATLRGVGAALVLLACWAHAEQLQLVGDHEVHYVVFPTTFLQPKIAEQYGLPRGRDRALVNVSVLGPDGKPIAATVTGRSENLLGQRQVLDFIEVKEDYAVYYLALLTHADEEHHRIALDVTLGNGERGEIRFTQKMYWDDS